MFELKEQKKRLG